MRPQSPNSGEDQVSCVICFVILLTILILVIATPVVILLFLNKRWTREPPMPKIELVSMDFTVLNITQTGLSAKWDMSVRIPNDLPGHFICLQGDLQASLLYKNVTLATSAPLKYENLKYNNPQILKVSQEDSIGGSIGKDLIKDVKERKEVQFGTKFFLTDCRKKTTGVMSYACDEATLRFESGSDMKATVFGNHPTCTSF